jgi:8-oxo-dGTP pyrophosphatase MutT (NUDIX family)
MLRAICAVNWLASYVHRVIMRRPIVLLAGGIMVRCERGEPRVLIVTTRRRKRWVLPKGRVEDGERPSTAALREVREEAGVSGKLRGRAGIAEYNTRGGRTRVEYFLFEYTRPTRKGGDDKREIRWCAVEDAIMLLTYASARRVLLDAYDRIEKLASALGA